MKKYAAFIVWIIIIFVSCNPGYAHADSQDSGDGLFEDYTINQNNKNVPDPVYWFNYGMYQFNDKLYFWLIKPVTKGYRAVVAREIRHGIKNFFYNLLFPVRFINSLLQGKFAGAGTELKIFLINSSAGCLGFAQPAQNDFGLKNSDEDLGQTLGSYAMGEGFYLVLPVLGPSTLRDFIGDVGDFFLKPVNYIEPDEAAVGAYAFDKINKTSFTLGDYKELKDSALDPYIAIKNAYIQLRREKTEK